MKKGFTFIITTLILIMLISSVLIINKPSRKKIDTKMTFLANNYENEFMYFSFSKNLDENKIYNFNKNITNFINSYNYTIEHCNIIETEEYIFISNFTNNPCMIEINGEETTPIETQSTIKIERFINNMSIYLCSCNYTTGKNKFYMNIYNENEKIIYKN